MFDSVGLQSTTFRLLGDFSTNCAINPDHPSILIYPDW